jgi:hypothetical protein
MANNASKQQLFSNNIIQQHDSTKHTNSSIINQQQHKHVHEISLAAQEQQNSRRIQYASNKTRPKNKSKASGDGSMQLKQTTAWCSRCFKTAARLCQQWYHVIDQTSPGTTATINKHGHGTLSSYNI